MEAKEIEKTIKKEKPVSMYINNEKLYGDLKNYFEKKVIGDKDFDNLIYLHKKNERHRKRAYIGRDKIPFSEEDYQARHKVLTELEETLRKRQEEYNAKTDEEKDAIIEEALKIRNDLVLLIKKIPDYLIKSPKFSGYPKEDQQDMYGSAILKIINGIEDYDITSNASPFSYFTSITLNEYLQYLNQMYLNNEKEVRLVFEENKDEFQGGED